MNSLSHVELIPCASITLNPHAECASLFLHRSGSLDEHSSWQL